MKKIFRGGYNPTDPVSMQNSTLCNYRNLLLQELERGKKIAIVTAAQVAGRYTDMIDPFVQKGALEIDRNFNKHLNWLLYDWVIVLGGGDSNSFRKTFFAQLFF